LWQGGLGTSHWNQTGNLNTTVVKDRPYLGYYPSQNFLSEQLALMRSVGFNYVLLSWWGWGVTNFSNPKSMNSLDVLMNQEALQVFQDVQMMNSTFKVVIMVDAFNASNTSLNSTDYTEIYNYVYDNFYKPYSNFTLSYGDRPLLLWFNPLDPPQNSSFTSRVVGNNLALAQWIWWRAPGQYFDAYGGTDNPPCTCYVGEPQISSDGFVSIIPRYDDYYLYLEGGRSGYMRVDYSYSQGLYQSEWDYVIGQAKRYNNVHLVLVNSWNEFHERTAIEPHYDFSNANAQTFYLINATQYYIGQLEDAPLAFQFTSLEYAAVIFLAVVAVLGLGAYSLRYLRR
jgi:hypothetical protein